MGPAGQEMTFSTERPSESIPACPRYRSPILWAAIVSILHLYPIGLASAEPSKSGKQKVIGIQLPLTGPASSFGSRLWIGVFISSLCEEMLRGVG
jgi:hypothetical protein